MALAPGTAFLIFVVGGTIAIVSKVVSSAVEKIGPQIEPNDLLPMPPPYPPLPRFLYTKPEIVKEIRE